MQIDAMERISGDQQRPHCEEKGWTLQLKVTNVKSLKFADLTHEYSKSRLVSFNYCSSCHRSCTCPNKI